VGVSGRRSFLCLMAVSLTPLAGFGAQPPGAAAASVQDFGARGPFPVVNHLEGADCTIFRPAVLGEGGRKHPIILWGNGTGSRPVNYAGLLNNWASHGFVVGAANSPRAGSGREMLACLDWMTARQAAPNNPYSGHLDLGRVGVSGHSQGAGGAIMAGRDPRITATAPIMPGGVRGAEAEQHGPMLLLSGSVDMTTLPARSQQPVFEAAARPVFWATLEGASHLAPGGDGGPYRAVTTAWFRARLMDDAVAARMFEGEACGLCAAPGWRVQRKGMG